MDLANISDDLEAELHEFMGEMREFKSTTERRLSNQGTSIDSIRDRVNNQPVCVFHAEMLAEQKLQRDRDLKHDEQIGDLKTQNAVIEYKLSPREAAQLNVASIGAALLGLWEVVKFIFKISV
jgi:hypothetical protein